MPGPPLLILLTNHNIYTGIVPVLDGFFENYRKSLNLFASKLLLAAILGPVLTGPADIMCIQEK
jgi:hypothetical protein